MYEELLFIVYKIRIFEWRHACIKRKWRAMQSGILSTLVPQVTILQHVLPMSISFPGYTHLL